MAHCNTVLSQLIKWVPRHEFETLAKRHHSGRSFRSASRWAQFVGLFMAQVTGSDLAIARTLHFPKGSLVAIDRGYNDYDWYNQLNDNGIFFVARVKKDAAYRVVSRAAVLKSKGLTCDQRIEFTAVKAFRQYPIPLRRIGYRDAETGKHYVFLTNNLKLAAKTIADIYKARWQVELFFKWIKQNLKIKSFIGTSNNAVMTQIWIALCVYLLLAFIKFQSRLGKSMQQMLRLLHLNLFDKRDLMALLRGEPPPRPDFNRNQSSLL